MGSSTGGIVFTITVDNQGKIVISDAQKQIQQLEQTATGATSKMSKGFASMAGAMAVGQLAVQGVMAVWRGLTDIVSSSSAEYLEADKIQKQFEGTLRNLGIATDANIAIFEDFAKGIQKTTTVDDETVKSLMGLGLRMGFTGETIRDATLSAIGLSKAFGIDLESAMKMVSQATEGNFRGMAQYLPAIKNAETASDKMAIAQKAMADGLKLAEDETKGLAGQMAQTANTINDNKEKIGELSAKFEALTQKALIPCVEILSEFVDWLNKATKHQIDSSWSKQFNENRLAFEAAAKAAGIYSQEMEKIFKASPEGWKNQEEGAKGYAKALDDLIATNPKAAAAFNEYFKAQKTVDLENKKITVSTKEVSEAQKEAAKITEKYGLNVKGLNEAGREQYFQLMQMVGLLPEFTDETQKAAEAQFWMGVEMLRIAGILPQTGDGYIGAGESVEKMKTSLDELTEAERLQFLQLMQLSGMIPGLDGLFGEASTATEKWYKDAQDLKAGLESLANVFNKMIPGLGDLISGFMGVRESIGKLNKAQSAGTANLGQYLSTMGAILGLAQVLYDLLPDLFSGSINMKPQEDAMKAQQKAAEEYAKTWRGILESMDGMAGRVQKPEESLRKLGSAFTTLLQDAQYFGTEGSKAIMDMFDALDARGLHVKEVDDYIKAQLASGLTGYEQMKAAMDPGDLKEKYNALVESMKGMEVGSVEYIKAQEELAKLKAGLTDVTAAQSVFGDMNIKVYEDMIAYNNKVAANPALTNAIAGATQALIGLSNTTRLSEGEFDGFGKSASTAFKKLTANGFTSKEAYQQLAPMLARLKFLHEEYGLTLDKETQRLLDGADAAGVNTDQAMSQEEAFGRMTGALEQMVVLLGGTLPDATNTATVALGKMTDGATDGITKLQAQIGNGMPLAYGSMADAAITAFDKTSKAVLGLSGSIDGALRDRVMDIAIKSEYSLGGKKPIAAATGWSGIVPGGSYTHFVTGEDEPEFVNITPMSKMGGGYNSSRPGSDSKQTVIIEDHSVIHIQVDPRSGIDQGDLTMAMTAVIKDNRQMIADTMAKAVARKL